MKKFTSFIKENRLFTTPKEKADFLNNDTQIINAFMLNFIGMAAAYDAAKNRDRILTHIKSDGKLRLNNIDDSNHDISLILKIMDNKDFFKTKQVANTMTRFLAKLKTGTIDNIDATQLQVWILAVKPEKLKLMSSTLLKIKNEFMKDDDVLKLAALFRQVHKKFQVEMGDFGAILRGVQFKKTEATKDAVADVKDGTGDIAAADVVDPDPAPAKQAKPDPKPAPAPAVKENIDVNNFEQVAKEVREGKLDIKRIYDFYNKPNAAIRQKLVHVLYYFFNEIKDPNIAQDVVIYGTTAVSESYYTFLSAPKNAKYLHGLTATNAAKSTFFASDVDMFLKSFEAGVYREIIDRFKDRLNTKYLDELEKYTFKVLYEPLKVLSNTSLDSIKSSMNGTYERVERIMSGNEIDKNYIINAFKMIRNPFGWRASQSDYNSWVLFCYWIAGDNLSLFLDRVNARPGYINIVQSGGKLILDTFGERSDWIDGKPVLFDYTEEIFAKMGIEVKSTDDALKILFDRVFNEHGGTFGAAYKQSTIESIYSGRNPAVKYDKATTADIDKAFLEKVNETNKSSDLMWYATVVIFSYPHTQNIILDVLNMFNRTGDLSAYELFLNNILDNISPSSSNGVMEALKVAKIKNVILDMTMDLNGSDPSKKIENTIKDTISGWNFPDNITKTVDFYNLIGYKKYSEAIAKVWKKMANERIEQMQSLMFQSNYKFQNDKYLSGLRDKSSWPYKRSLYTFLDEKEFNSLRNKLLATIATEFEMGTDSDTTSAVVSKFANAITALSEGAKFSEWEPKTQKAIIDMMKEISANKLIKKTTRFGYNMLDGNMIDKLPDDVIQVGGPSDVLAAVSKIQNEDDKKLYIEKYIKNPDKLESVLLIDTENDGRIALLLGKNSQTIQAGQDKIVDLISNKISANISAAKSTTYVHDNIMQDLADDNYNLSAKQKEIMLRNIGEAVDNNLNKRKKEYKEIMTSYQRGWYDLVADDPKAAEFIYTTSSPSFRRRLANQYLSQKGFTGMLTATLGAGDIAPYEQLDSKRIKQILKYNNVTSVETTVKDKYIKTFKDMDAYVAAHKESEGALKDLQIDTVEKTKDELDKLSAEWHQTKRNNVHGRNGLKILREFNVHIPRQVEEQAAWIEANPDQEIVNPMFHGTGSIAASMILRYGFRVISKGDKSVVGRMLGAGVYGAIHVDKSQQYIGDGGFSRSNGLKGYIFACNCALGEKGKDYEAAGLGGRDGIRSPEWCVFTPNAQMKIEKAYEVEIVDPKYMSHLVDKYKVVQQEENLKGFKDFLKEESEIKVARRVSTYTFVNGIIPVSFDQNEDFADFKSPNDNVKLEPSAYGPQIVVYDVEEEQNLMFTSASDFRVNHPEEFTTYLKYLIKK